jgi:hypothetical protein
VSRLLVEDSQDRCEIQGGLDWGQSQYEVSLFTRYEEKNWMTFSGNPDCLRIAMSMPWFREGKNCAISNAITLVLRPLAHPALTR